MLSCATELTRVFVSPAISETAHNWPCRKDNIVIKMLGTEAEFEILNVMEYSSARGRMSVIARSADGSVRLLSKGSDSKVMKILHKGVEKALLDATNQNLHLFATQVYILHCP